MSAAKTCASLTTYRIDLIDEYDTRSILLSLIEQVSYTGCSDADKHFNEVGTTDGKERHTGFSGSRLGNIRFTGSRRTYQQDSLRDPCPQTVIFSRMTEKINDFFQFLFFFLQTCDVLKGDLAQITAPPPLWFMMRIKNTTMMPIMISVGSRLIQMDSFFGSSLLSFKEPSST